MKLAHSLVIGYLAMSLLGCGANKGTQKGTDDQLKIQDTIVGGKGVPLPSGANEKNSKENKLGGPGSGAPGKGGPPPPSK